MLPDNSPVEDSDTYTEVLVQQPMFTVTKTQTGGPNPVAIAGPILLTIPLMWSIHR